MKTKILRIGFAMAAALSTAFASPQLYAAAGDLYVSGHWIYGGAGPIYRFTPAGVKALASNLRADYLAFDAKGNLFASTGTYIAKITPAGTITTFASGISPRGLAFDQFGNLYAADYTTSAIYKYTPSGVRTTFATGIKAFYLKFDRFDNLFASVGDFGEPGFVVKFTSGGTRTTFASGFDAPRGLAFDQAGNLYVANFGVDAGAILKFTPAGVRSTFFDAVTHPIEALIMGPRSLVIDPGGNLFVGDWDYDRIVKFPAVNFTPTATPSVFARNVYVGFTVYNFGSLAIEPGMPGVLANLSTRLGVGTNNNVLIGGFIIGGTGPKQLVLRALGPTLTQFGISGVLQNPIMELHNSTGGLITFNDNWAQAANASFIPTNLRPPNNAESAILATLNPGSYTAIVRGVNRTTGIALVEVYDIATGATSHLSNISSRGLVQTGTNVMIAGVIVQSGTENVLVRALGPTLASFGISNPLANPTLELHDAYGVVIAANDNWKSTQQAQIIATGKAPPDDLESAIVGALGSGNYTAVVRGVNNTTGVALAEVYALQ